jgi:hypothetical protein
VFSRKLDAIGCWRSQTQIARLVERVRNGGPEEYFRILTFPAYAPSMYRGLFDE